MQDRSRRFALSSTSPSLGRCSSINLAEIAARVVDELRAEEPLIEDDWRNPPRNFADDLNDGEEAADDRGFEFDFVCREPAITADEIFYNGQIRPLYPYSFDSSAERNEANETKPPVRQRRPALRKLMSEERDSTSCTSSEGDDELAGVAPEAYCVWSPKRTEDRLGDSSSPSRSKVRSKSIGSSKRWNLRDLLYVRSSREGKQMFKSLSSSKKNMKLESAV